MGVNEFDIRNPESRYLTRGWHFANAGFLEISHLWEINPKFLKIMIVGVLQGPKAFQWEGVIKIWTRGQNFAQFSKCSECDENSSIASVSSS
jgi:hypothetical protein